ncbi:MAG: hypothetical protein V8T45_08875 [Oscillospiraceae bacterium]
MIQGVKEDVTEIVLNVKGLNLIANSTVRTLKTVLILKSAASARSPPASSSLDGPEVEILNPDMYICYHWSRGRR